MGDDRVEITPEIRRAVLGEFGKRGAESRIREEKTCARPGCGNQFVGIKKSAYCSDACRAADYYQKRKDDLNRMQRERRQRAASAAPAPADATGPESGTPS